MRKLTARLPARVLRLRPAIANERATTLATHVRLGTRLGRLLRLIALPLLLLAGWEIVTRQEIWQPWQVPAPRFIWMSFRHLFSTGELAAHVGTSLLRVLQGAAIGTACGIVLGTLTGVSRRCEEFIDHTLQGMKSVPTVAWIPLLVLWFGIGETPKLILIALGAFFPVYVNLVSGIRGVDRKWIEVGRVYRQSEFAIFRRIILPASFPHLATGIRIGLTQAWLFMVISEMIGTDRGLGFLVFFGREVSRADLIIVSMLLLAVLGKVIDSLIRRIEARLLHWQDTYQTQGR